jgi:transcriptional regulator with XRE-family HTH domain
MASTLLRMNTMTPEDKTFYIELGQRVAQARKHRNLTQQQLSESLGISQQALAHYEGGILRISVAMLLAIADELQVHSDELLYGAASNKVKSKRGPDSKLQLQIEKIRQLPRTKQQFVMDMLDTVIQQSAT